MELYRTLHKVKKIAKRRVECYQSYHTISNHELLQPGTCNMIRVLYAIFIKSAIIILAVYSQFNAIYHIN
jgi:hypothetical protein